MLHPVLPAPRSPAVPEASAVTRSAVDALDAEARTGATVYTVDVPAGYPFPRRLTELARAAGIAQWRVLNDGRRFWRGGPVTFELIATPRQLRSFAAFWAQMRRGIWGSMI